MTSLNSRIGQAGRKGLNDAFKNVPSNVYINGKGELLEALEELAARAASGDKAAFADIYGVLMDSVYKYLFWNLGSTDDAEDLTEEVFLRCIVNIASYNPKRGAFRSWIFRIAHNILMDHHRRNKRRGDEPLKDELHNGSAGTAGRGEKKERARALQK